jgi:hypothetical protein
MFLGGLNREIQDVLDYKEYTNITRLFHLACKAEHVQGRHARTQANSFAGRTMSFHSGPKPVAVPPPVAPSPPSSTPRDKAVAKNPAPLPATKGASFSGRSKDIQCHRCKGFGHVIQDYPNKRTLLISDNGEYSSTSDSEETIYAMVATDVAGTQEEHVDATMLTSMRVLLCNAYSACRLHNQSSTSTTSTTPCSIPKALCKNAPFTSLLTVAAATTWQAWR